MAAGGRRNFAKAPQRVRIIGGSWKRTPLPVHFVDGLRPTPDRVRETLFNWIDHLIPDLDAVRGLDMFAGTGALGFELASRGAHHVTLIESDRRLVDQLTATKRKLDAMQIDVVADSAIAVAARLSDAAFDVIFLDPPFDSDLMRPALTAAARLLTLQGLIYVENNTLLDPSIVPRGFAVVRAGRAGRVHFNLLRRQSHE